MRWWYVSSRKVVTFKSIAATGIRAAISPFVAFLVLLKSKRSKNRANERIAKLQEIIDKRLTPRKLLG